MSQRRTFIDNVFAQGLGRAFMTVVNFIVFILIARVMGTEIFGQFSYLITFIALLGMFADFGTQVVLARDISQYRDDGGRYWGNFLMLRTIITLLMAALGLVLAYYLRPDLFWLLAISCLALPLLTWRFFEPLYQVYEKPNYAAWTAMIFSVTYFILVLLAVLWFRHLQGIFVAYLSANVVFTGICFWYCQKLLTPKFDWDTELVKRMLKLAIPVGVGSIYTIVNSKADIFMLAALKGDHEVGIYNAAYRFLDLTAVMASTLTMPLIPIWGRYAAEDRVRLKANFKEMMAASTVFTIPLALSVPVFSKELIALVFGTEFGAAAQVMNILAWVGVLVFYSLLGSAANLAVGDIKHSYWNGALAATVNIILNFLWIPKYGFIGSTWATLISEVLLLSVCLFHVIRNLDHFVSGALWSKIMLANLVFFGVIQLRWTILPSALCLLLAVVVYVYFVKRWRLIDESIVGLIKRKILRQKGGDHEIRCS